MYVHDSARMTCIDFEERAANRLFIAISSRKQVAQISVNTFTRMIEISIFLYCSNEYNASKRDIRLISNKLDKSYLNSDHLSIIVRNIERETRLSLVFLLSLRFFFLFFFYYSFIYLLARSEIIRIFGRIEISFSN